MMIIIPVSLILGFFFSRELGAFTRWMPMLFAYLTFVMAMGCGPAQIKEALRMPRQMLVTLTAAHIVAPLAAYGLGVLLFGAHSPFVIGLVLFTVIPLGVSSVIWVGIAGGNVPLSLSMIVLDSLLSPIVVPGEIAFFFGAQIEIDLWQVMLDLLEIIVIPTILGVAVHQLSRGKAKPLTAPFALPTSKLCFLGVVLINAAAIRPSVISMRGDMPRLLPIVILLVFLCYLLGYIGGLPFRQRGLSVTLMYSSGMRNISLGVVLGVSYFQPAAAVPVVMSILVQQPIATLIHSVIRKFMSAGYRLSRATQAGRAPNDPDGEKR